MIKSLFGLTLYVYMYICRTTRREMGIVVALRVETGKEKERALNVCFSFY